MNIEPTEAQLDSIRKKGVASPSEDIEIAGPLAVAIVDNYRELTAKAALVEQLADVLHKFMQINNRHGYEFDSNEPEWFAEARAVLARKQ